MSILVVYFNVPLIVLGFLFENIFYAYCAIITVYETMFASCILSNNSCTLCTLSHFMYMSIREFKTKILKLQAPCTHFHTPNLMFIIISVVKVNSPLIVLGIFFENPFFAYRAIIANHETIFASCILSNNLWALCILSHFMYIYIRAFKTQTFKLQAPCRHFHITNSNFMSILAMKFSGQSIVLGIFSKNPFYTYCVIIVHHETLFASCILSNNSWTLCISPYFMYMSIRVFKTQIFELEAPCRHFYIPNSSFISILVVNFNIPLIVLGFFFENYFVYIMQS